MFAKLAMACAALGLLMSTASADYYIVQEKASKKCKVVETKPTETTLIQVGPASFKTQSDAEKQIKDDLRREITTIATPTPGGKRGGLQANGKSPSRWGLIFKGVPSW